MTSQANTRAAKGCLGVLLAALLGVSWLAAASLNPLAVFGSRSLAGKVAVVVLGMLAVSILVQLLVLFATRAAISRVSGRPADDVLCPGCGLPLLHYASSHGPPVLCPGCREWWHAGSRCFNRDTPERTSPLPMHPCPTCTATARSLELREELGVWPPRA